MFRIDDMNPKRDQAMQLRIWYLILPISLFALAGCAGSSQADATASAQEAASGSIAAVEPASGGGSTADGGIAAQPGGSGAAEDPAAAPGSGAITFAIDPALSEARFVIGEVLGGQPNTVIGVNQQISGSAQVSFEQPEASLLGQIQIQAAGFRTDSDLRDRAINQFILQSSTFPAIRFLPGAIRGLPSVVAPGHRVSLEIQGELIIHEISQPVTFVAELTVVSASQLQGTATATVRRADYDLEIPRVPRVASVDEEFILQIDFVMLAG